MINVIEKVKSYNGQDTFLKSLSQNLHKYGRLTEKQMNLATRILMSEEKTKEINMDELPENIKKIMMYEGPNDFVHNIKEQYTKWRSLTEKQISSAIRQIEKEGNPVIDFVFPLNNESITLKRGIALKIKKEYGFQFMPILVDVVKTTKLSKKAIKIVAKLTKQNGDVCRCCGATLTDHFSMITGIGPICSKNLGVKYIKNSTELKRFEQELSDKIDEIGEFEFWLPKSQIKEYIGKGKLKFIATKMVN
jgi:hypothetical protein